MTEDLPPSALFVRFYLENHTDGKDVPRSEIVEETGMKPRTVSRACERLENQDIIEEAADWNDLRDTVYRLRRQNVVFPES